MTERKSHAEVHYGNLESLKNAILNSKRPITFLFGSALTAPRSEEDAGIPTTAGLVELVRSSARDANCYDKIETVLSEKPMTVGYQDALEILFHNAGADAVADVIQQAITSALKQPLDLTAPDVQKQPALWHISPTLDALASLYLYAPQRFSGLILTTNFDTLIELAFAARGLSPITLALDGDFSLKPYSQADPARACIVHLHGTWQTETLHTRLQLRSSRRTLRNGLVEILRDSMLVPDLVHRPPAEAA